MNREQAASAEGAGVGVSRRDAAIDGWRGIAVGCVVCSHAISYRFADVKGPIGHYAGRLSGPLAELGVQLFFVISGFIITSLLLREQTTSGRVSLPAFYARRTFRILPPLFVFYAVLIMATIAGVIALSPVGLASSATFTCNVGFVECDWWVAHTWSLAVEEQFYIGWPLLFALVAPVLRQRLLAATLLILTVGYFFQPPTFHSNITSFACIAIGALVATSGRARAAILRTAHTVPWLVVGAVILLAPLTPAGRLIGALLPLLIAYLLFAGNALGWVRAVLSSAPLQLLGLVSYSLYLWQQLFLADPSLYLAGPPSLLWLPVAVAASVWLVEKPFIRLGHRLSARLKARQRERALEDAGDHLQIVH